MGSEFTAQTLLGKEILEGEELRSRPLCCRHHGKLKVNAIVLLNNLLAHDHSRLKRFCSEG
ncbi:hypothetical protein [Fischerella thermalis]|uniref:hypothetical protein n=1 Tax=Fischerella thermalis TaxID=372787 RepID=UPI0011AF4765|nr:hypothetical protein [Fischerella thermalis]